MVMLWSSLASRDARLAAAALRRMKSIPAGTAWMTYLRCHDDIGWAVSDEDAWSVGLDPASHRAFLSDFFSGMHPGSFARGEVFQHTTHARATGASPARRRHCAGSTPRARRATRSRSTKAYDGC